MKMLVLKLPKLKIPHNTNTNVQGCKKITTKKSEGTRQDATKQSETQLEVFSPWSNKKRYRNSSVGTSKAWQEERNLDTENKKAAIGETKEKAECPEMDEDKPEEETVETLNPQK